MSLFDRIEALLGIGAVLVIGIMAMAFFASGGYKSVDATTSFISGLMIFGVNVSIPLAVTLIAAFGVVGLIIMVILKAVK